jgi:hypothetical protein
MVQKNAGFVFNYFVERAERDYETAATVRDQQQIASRRSVTFDPAISQVRGRPLDTQETP